MWAKWKKSTYGFITLGMLGLKRQTACCLRTTYLCSSLKLDFFCSSLLCWRDKSRTSARPSYLISDWLPYFQRQIDSSPPPLPLFLPLPFSPTLTLFPVCLSIIQSLALAPSSLSFLLSLSLFLSLSLTLRLIVRFPLIMRVDGC